MNHDIPAKSRLIPAIPITNPKFVYRPARETDVRLTFARARLESPPGPDRGAEAPPSGSARQAPRRS